MSKRAGIYARVSTDDQRGNYSVPTQVEQCLKHLQDRGYALVGNQCVDRETGRDVPCQAGAVMAFVDDYTSRELSRPALDAAFSYLETFGFDVLVVHSLDRLARDPYIRQTLELEFEKHGAAVEYVIGNYEETPEGEVRKDLDATFAKWENLKRVERANRGKIAKAHRGLFVVGDPPLGYRLDKNALGGVAIDEEEGATVKRVFELYTEEGYSINGIANVLTSEGVRPRRGGRKWCSSSVGKILRNTAYIGRVYYNKSRSLGSQSVKRDRGEWIEIRVTPMVDQETFAAAQRRLQANRETVRRRPKRFYLLSGLILCSECGRNYAGQTALAGKNRRINDGQYYRHVGIQGQCRNRNISARILEGAVWSEIVQLLLDPGNLRRGYEGAQAQERVEEGKKRAELEASIGQVTKLEQQQEKLTETYLDPDIGLSKAEYVAQRDRLEARLKATRESIAALQKELQNVPSGGDLPRLEEFSEAIRRSFGDTVALTAVEKRTILELLNIRVLIGCNGDIHLQGWINPSSDGLLNTASSNWPAPSLI